MTLNLNLLVYSNVKNTVLWGRRIFLSFHPSLTHMSTCIHSHIHKRKKQITQLNVIRNSSHKLITEIFYYQGGPSLCDIIAWPASSLSSLNSCFDPLFYSSFISLGFHSCTILVLTMSSLQFFFFLVEIFV